MIDRCYIEITNVCNLDCDFCPKHTRQPRRLTMEEFDIITDKLRDRCVFLYFHLMGEPLLHPLLPDFIRMSRAKGFRTVLTSNGTLLTRAQALLDSLPHKVQLSLHSHEANVTGELTEYMDQVMTFATEAAARGTCVVLRLWNQGGHTSETDDIVRHMERYVPRPWRERPDGYRLTDNLYLEYDRKFRWPEASWASAAESSADSVPSDATREVHCRALQKQIGVLADGSLVPCCLDHNGAIVLGNLLRQSLDDILSSPRAKALVDGFDHHRAVEPLCQSCESASVRHSFRGKARRSLS